MPIEFVPAVRDRTRLIISFAGPTGSGKTRSALECARGLAAHPGEDLNDPATLAIVDARIKAIDTENGRLLFFAPKRGQKLGKGVFGFLHGNMRPPYPPAAYMAALEQGAQGCEVLMIDSFSHEWDGEGGMHDMHTEALERMMARNPNLSEDSVSSLAWRDPKMEHRRLVSKMLQIAPYLIVCLRAEDKLLIERVPVNPDNPKGPKKTVFVPASERPLEDRWVPICDKRFPFEITISLGMTPEKPGVPYAIKLNDEHRFAVDLTKQVTPEMGRLLSDWANGRDGAPAGDPGLVAELLPAAWGSWSNEERGANRALAGVAAFRSWWKTLAPADKELLKKNLPEWQSTAEKKP